MTDIDATQPLPEGAAPPVSPPAASPSPDFQNINFNGTGKEFFGIWVSNLFLSIITLGIYSTWAKVRRMKYFYNNTFIENFSLNYHATGMQLLKGRIVAIVILVVYSIITTMIPITAILFSLAFLVAAPWIINRSLRFSARMTSWRNVRLNWHGTYLRSLVYFLLAPMISVLSLGLLVPWVARNYYRYYAEGHSFGVERFVTNTKLSDYYKGFFVGAVLPAIVALALWFGLSTIQNPYAMQGPYGNPMQYQLIPICLVVFFFLTQIIYGAICRNILLRNMTLGTAAEFNSSMKPFQWLWIELSNAFAIVFSLGLLIPWAMVRRYKYLSDNTSINLKDSATFVDEQTAAMGAFGEEFADLDGIEIGI